MKEENLFVYGTLRRDTGTHMYHLLARYAKFIGEATYQGLLFKIDYYPGAVASDNPAHKVLGEVYCLLAPDLVLRKLDQYEECGPGFLAPTEYIRVEQVVTLSSGEQIIVWMYIYNRSTQGLTLIPSGNFLDIDTGM
jgi:gamma-glutamylcyclotransferase (GGCT)/AIG2-like uncharacterized protein YtfP